jgi:hypothetical protein
MSPRKSVLVSAAVTVDAKLDPAGQAAGAKQPAASAGSKVNDGVLPEMEPVRLQTQLMQLAITQVSLEGGVRSGWVMNQKKGV